MRGRVCRGVCQLVDRVVGVAGYGAVELLSDPVSEVVVLVPRGSGRAATGHAGIR